MILYSLFIVLLVDSLVVLGLPDFYFIAVLDVVAYPFGDILGGRVEREYIVEILVVEGPGDFFLDAGEVRDHAVDVESLGFAVHDHYPVVPVESLAFAFVAEVEAVGR